MDYMHYKPVKHRLARCPHAWPHSSLAKWVRQGAYAADWVCLCAGGEAYTFNKREPADVV